MPLKLKDRVFETSLTQGTGTINLLGPVTNFRAFASVYSDNDQLAYIIDDATGFEIGIGTFQEGTPDQLTRDTVYSSSNANALVNWGPGTRNVRVGPIADLIYSRTVNRNVIIGQGTSGGTATAHTVSMDVSPLAYEANMQITYLAPAASTGAVTVNVDGLGAKGLKYMGQDLVAGDLLLNDPVRAFYNGTYFEIVSPVRVSGTSQTGDIIASFTASPRTGWLFLNGDTIGSTSSGATKAGAQYEALFLHLWGALANAQAAVSGGRGASAAADWAANKTLTIPDSRTGKSLVGAGSGFTIGATGGATTKTLVEANLPSHFHAAGSLSTDSTGSHQHNHGYASNSAAAPQYGTAGSAHNRRHLGATDALGNNPLTSSSGSHSHTISGNTGSTGSGTAFDVMNPWLSINWMIKL